MNWLWLNHATFKTRWLINMTNVNYIYRNGNSTKIVFNDNSDIDVEETLEAIASKIRFESIMPRKEKP